MRMPFRWFPDRSHGTRSIGAWLTAAALLALPALAIATPPAGYADEVSVPQASQEDVFRELDVDEVPADYVVLVDTSASMQENNRYDSVKSSLRSFFDSLRPIDRVTLITFDELPSVIQRGDPGSATAAIDRLPAVPLGSTTDIGMAIEEAFRQLDSPDAARAGAVVLFTDGMHKPSVNSAYDSPEAWLTLAGRGDALADHVRGYAIPLASDESGARQLQSVLAGTVVLKLPDGQLSDYLSQVARERGETIAVSRVRTDLTGGVDVSWRQPLTGLDFSGEVPITVDLRATTSVLPIDVVDLQVTLTGIDATVTGLPSRLTLPAGDSRPVTFTVQATDGPGLQLGRTRSAVAADLRITALVDSSWRTVVTDDLRQQLALRPLAAGTPLSGTTVSGLSWAGVGASGGALLAVLVLIAWWWHHRHPRLTGTLIAEPSDGPPAEIDLRGHRLVRFARPQNPGRPRVSGEFVVRGSTEQGHVVPIVVYRPDDGPSSSPLRCPEGAAVDVHGILLTYSATSSASLVRD